jgi:methionine-rich copper-binding protein CopC
VRATVATNPDRRSRTLAPTLARTLVSVSLVALLSCLSGSPATGHVLLSSASPEPESSATGVPTQVQLHFAIPAVGDGRTWVSVVDASGRDLATGDPVVSGLGVSQALESSGETGWYQVSYRVVIWGGHVDSGEFRFLVKPSDDGVSVTTWILIVGGALTLGALALIGRARRRVTSAPSLANRVTVGSDPHQP